MRIREDYKNKHLYFSATPFVICGFLFAAALVGIFSLQFIYVFWGLGAVLLYFTFWIFLAFFIAYKLIKSASYGSTYTISNKDVQYKLDFLFKKNTQIDLTDIKTIDIEQGPIQRMFGIGDVKIKTAAYSNSTQGKESGLITITTIPNFQEVYDYIKKQKTKAISTQSSEPKDNQSLTANKITIIKKMKEDSNMDDEAIADSLGVDIDVVKAL